MKSMSNIVPLSPLAVAPKDFSAQDLKLIKRTVAADTTDDEFSLFVSYCRALQLDPRRKQIYCLVYNKDKPEKRKMSIIVGIDGFRSIAARTGNYRPDDEPTAFVYDEAAKGPANPTGLVSASLRVWQYSHGQWFKVSGEARWSEFAPIEDEWMWNSETGKRAKTGAQKPGGKWADMPTIMLAKCAEAQALRKAWPDHFANVYAPEEMDQAQAEILDPVEAVRQAEEEDRQKRVGGGRSIIVDWMQEGVALDSVPVGQFIDRAMEFVEKHKDEPSTVAMWRERNRFGLRDAWANNPGDTLALKSRIDAIINASGEVE